MDAGSSATTPHAAVFLVDKRTGSDPRFSRSGCGPVTTGPNRGEPGAKAPAGPTLSMTERLWGRQGAAAPQPGSGRGSRRRAGLVTQPEHLGARTATLAIVSGMPCP